MFRRKLYLKKTTIQYDVQMVDRHENRLFYDFKKVFYGTILYTWFTEYKHNVYSNKDNIKS